MSAQDMSSAARDARRKYMQQWRKDNPDKVRAASARYWQKRAAEMEQQGKEGDGK